MQIPDPQTWKSLPAKTKRLNSLSTKGISTLNRPSKSWTANGKSGNSMPCANGTIIHLALGQTYLMSLSL